MSDGIGGTGRRTAARRPVSGWRAHRVLLALVALLLLGLAARNTSRANAEPAIVIASTPVHVQFPTAATFSLNAHSVAPIVSVGLEVETPEKTYGAVPLDVQPSFTPGTDVAASWTWQSPGPGRNLPPGADISYQWTVANADGIRMQTGVEHIRYRDDRYPWKTVSGSGIHLSWYDGDAAFGDQLLRAASGGLQQLGEQQGVDLRADLTVYIYSSQRALRGAMVGSPTWIGGRAYPEFNTILLIVSRDDIEEGRRSLLHEMTHQLVYQQTFDPLLGSHVPQWLNEGLAVTSEGSTAPEFKDALATAVSAHDLPPLRTYDGAFPSDARASTLAYAASESFVRYLLKTYNAAGMRALLSSYQHGSRTDQALLSAYGHTLDQLQDAWRASIGATAFGGVPVAEGRSASRSRFWRAGQVQAIVQTPAFLAGSFVVVSVALVVAIAVWLKARLRGFRV